MADLRLSVWFDKDAYLAQEPITAHATVTNVGTAAAGEARVNSTGNLSSESWATLSPSGAPIEPGQTVESRTTGYVTTDSGPLTITVTVRLLGDQADANPTDNAVTASVPVTHVRGSYRGTVYGDRNGNRTMDPGEALSGIRVGTSGGNPNVVRTAVTDAEGHFVFLDLPAGGYWTWFDSTDWHLTAPSVEVTGMNDPDVLIRGVPSAATWLSASAEFTRGSYRVNDVAHLTMTLTNKGTALMTNLTADCWATAAGQVDTGKLAASGPGVAVPSGATRTVDMTVRITEEAATEGNLRVWCSVGAPPHLNGPSAVRATARVPGGMAPKVVGYLGLFRYKPILGFPSSDPLPGVKVYLRNQVTGAVVARAVSGTGGDFTFYEVPAGIYEFGIVGPWRLVYTDPEFLVRDGENGVIQTIPYNHHIIVVPGPNQADPDPAPQPGGQPAPTFPAAVAPRPVAAQPAGLATTGVEVTWLALSAFLTTIIGVGLVFGTVRRRPR
ncbi:CARDB domain-containing protein [Amycolatopsis sp. MtRt-6]|uniref:CARDB domain-containing protein n=1 Tax=Amycolatopsis sp. MtRt-6 TaxID=2792782 RepID=UPI001A8C2557|nr:CARDB domain-containing protein [Amycolatopsis sp. MtRt-6]